MQKKNIALLSGLALGALQLVANDIEPSKEFYNASRAGGPMTIDGLLTDWSGVPVLSDPRFSICPGQEGTGAAEGCGDAGNLVLFERYQGGDWTGPDDHTSAVQVVYDADNVYFGFVVTDEYHENAANSAWNGDSVQLMVADANRTTQVGLYNYALGGVEGATTDVIVMHEAGPGNTEAVVTRDPVAKKTYYEIRLPASALGLTAPLTAGMKFGLGMAINDGDEATPGQKGWGGLGAHSIVYNGKDPTETALITLTTNLPTTDSIFFSAINPTFNSFTFRATDKGTAIVAPATAKLTIDNQVVTLVPGTRVGDAIDFSYTPPSPFLPNSDHTYIIEVKDTSGKTVTSEGTFKTIAYALLTPADKVTADTTKPGFIWSVHQNPTQTENSVNRSILQLAGLRGQNFADPAAQGVALAPGTVGANGNLPIRFEIDSVINLNQDAVAEQNGDIVPDDQMPGIPGTSATAPTDGIAGEVITYLQLAAGQHRLIVNSDDGFRTTAGNINDVFRAQVAGAFDALGGRGAADSSFTIFVQEAGVYGFRTLWHEGGGGANLELKSVLADGTTEVLLNDRAGGGIPAYRAATGLPTSISSVVPVPGSTSAPGDTPLQITIFEGAAAVDLNSVTVSFNGAPISAPATRSGNLVTVNYQPPALLLPNSSNTVSLTFTAGGVSRTENWGFRVANYGYLRSGMRVTADTTKPGFIWNVHQNPGFTATVNSRPILQLAGSLGENFADPAAQGIAIAPGTPGANNRLPVRFEIESVINMNQDAAVEQNGDIVPDDQMPGIPGLSETAPTDGIAGEILTFIELPAGKNTMIVNSDDNFITTAGVLNDVFGAQTLGLFNAGRGAADTAYEFFVEQAGVYPFRTIWAEGGGGANIEWKWVKPDGSEVLINDVANGGPKAYRVSTSTSTGPSITSVSPGIGSNKAAANAAVTVVIQQGSTALDANSIQLTVDGAPVTPTVTTAGQTTTVSFQPAASFTQDATHTARIRFTAGGTERIENWSFFVPPTTLDEISNRAGLILGSADYTPDAGGRTGQAGDRAIDLGRGGGTPSVLIPDASFVNATTAGDVMTFSVWVKKYDNANSSVFWADSPSSPSGMRGFQAHTPWSDNNVYFDTAGCCAADATRISAGIDTFPGFTDATWWTGAWHHWAFVKNGATKHIYIDGQLFHEGGGTTPLPTDFARIWLGAEGGGENNGTANNMHGLIDDFAVFGTALSAADVQRLFSGTLPSAMGAATKPLAHWDFNDAPVVVDRPTMTITRAVGGATTISWPAGAAGFRLRSATSVRGPFADVPGVTGNSHTVSNPTGTVFYILQQ